MGASTWMSSTGSSPNLWGIVLPDEGLERRGDLLGLLPLDEEEVRLRALGRQLGHEAFVDPVGVDDDEALGALAEDVPQTHDIGDARADDVSENGAGADRGELVDVADEHELAVEGQRLEEVVGQHRVDHRRLVEDHEVGFEGVGRVAVEPELLGVELQQAMDRLRLPPRRFGHPLGRPARGRGKQDAPPLLLQDADDAVDERRFAGAGAARHDEELAGGRLADGLPLFLGELDPLLLLEPGDGALDVDADRATLGPEKHPDATGPGRLRRVQALEVDRIIAGRQRVDDDALLGCEVADRLLDDRRIDCQDLHRRRQEPRARDVHVPLVREGRQDVQDARLGPQR